MVSHKRDRDSAEWNTAAQGPAKRLRADTQAGIALSHALQAHQSSCALVKCGIGDSLCLRVGCHRNVTNVVRPLAQRLLE